MQSGAVALHFEDHLVTGAHRLLRDSERFAIPQLHAVEFQNTIVDHETRSVRGTSRNDDGHSDSR